MRRRSDDPFSKKARRENFEARSVYKLQEIDQKENILKGVKTILDLGSSPGSWSHYCVKQKTDVKVIAVDINPMRFTHPRVTFIQADMQDPNLSLPIEANRVDLILSDAAPKTTGLHEQDVSRSLQLAEVALKMAQRYLRQGGSLVAKLFMGEDFEGFHKCLKEHFEMVRLLRPETTRKRSREIYFIAKNRREI